MSFLNRVLCDIVRDSFVVGDDQGVTINHSVVCIVNKVLRDVVRDSCIVQFVTHYSAVCGQGFTNNNSIANS